VQAILLLARRLMEHNTSRYSLLCCNALSINSARMVPQSTSVSCPKAHAAHRECPTSAADVGVWFSEGWQVVSVVCRNASDLWDGNLLPSFGLGTLNHLCLRAETPKGCQVIIPYDMLQFPHEGLSRPFQPYGRFVGQTESLRPMCANLDN
jgi:hypothetical protein